MPVNVERNAIIWPLFDEKGRRLMGKGTGLICEESESPFVVTDFSDIISII